MFKKKILRRRWNNKNQNFETTKPCGSMCGGGGSRNGKLSFFTVKQPYLWPNIYYLNIKGEGYEKSSRGSYCRDGFPSIPVYRSMATPNRRTLFFNDFHKAFIFSQVLGYIYFFYPSLNILFYIRKRNIIILYIYYIHIYLYILLPLLEYFIHTLSEMTETRHDINPNNNDIKKLCWLKVCFFLSVIIFFYSGSLFLYKTKVVSCFIRFEFP